MLFEFGGTAVTLGGFNGGTENTGGWISGDVEALISGGKIYGPVTAVNKHDWEK